MKLQAMYVKRNVEESSRNNSYRGKQRYYILLCVRACVWMGVSEKAWACACPLLSLLIQHSTRRRHIVYGHSDSTVFFRHYAINGKTFEKPLLNIKCALIFSTQFL